MGNKNSSISKAHSGKIAKVASTEPHYVVSMQRKLSSEPEIVSLWAYPTQQQGEPELPLCDDNTFSDYIQRTKYKIGIITNNGFHEEQSYPAPTNVANGTNNYNNKENERDPFSDFIQDAKKKMRTLSRNDSSFRRG